MKSIAAFQFTVGKMAAGGVRLYFWTFTFRDVHCLKTAMGLWNEFLTIVKRKIRFRGVRVLELHEDHGVHFHVVTNKRYKIRQILEMSARYGFGRIGVERVTDVAGGITYLCKYLSKPRPPCLKRVRLWAAFGDIPRTRVADIVTDSPFVRILRDLMGVASPDQLLQRVAVEMSPKRSFIKVLPDAHRKNMASFDPSYSTRQAAWQRLRFQRKCIPSTEWLELNPAFEIEE